MSLEFSAAFDLLKSLASKVGGKSEVTEKDVKKMMKDADTDGDGIISEAEFKEVYMSTEEYEKLEEDYMEAFEAVAELDGEEGISSEDLDSAVEKYEEEQAAKEEDGDSSSTGGGPGGPGGPGNPGTNPNTTPNPEGTSDGSLDPVSLSEQNTMDELTGKRDSAMDTVASQREAKEAAIADAEAKTEAEKEKYDNATKAFADKLKEKDEALTEAEQNIVDLEDCKTALNEEITNQESKVTEAQSAADDAKAQVSDIEGQISSLGSAPPATITVTDSEGNTSTVPNPAYEAWVAKKEALEAKLAEAKDAQAEAEIKLSEAEEQLTGLEDELTLIESTLNAQINEYMQTEAAADQELQQLNTEITNTSKEYNDAKAAENEIAAPFDAEIEKAKADLEAYDEAMEIEEMPEDWSKEDKAGLEEVDKSSLPPDYEVKDGKIYDAEGNEVGKVVSGEEDESTGEKSEDRYYMKKEPEEQNLSFIDRYDMAQKLAKAEDPEKAWKEVDFSKLSSEDIAKIGELYEKEMAENKQEAVDQATEGLPATFLDAAEKYLADEEGTAGQFKEIVDGLLDASEENEKAAEMLTKEIDAALQSGDTKVLETLIASADANYDAFMKYVSETGLPSKIQSMMGKEADKVLSDLYSKVDQHKGTDAENYGIEEERANELKDAYLTGDTSRDLENLMKAINEGTITNPSEINYLLAQFGDSASIMSAANNLVEQGKLKPEDIDTIFRVSTTKQAEIMDAVNSDPEFAKYLEEQGLDPMKSDIKDLDKAMKDYEIANIGKEELIPQELVEKYLGEDYQAKLEELKSDPEKLQKEIDKLVDKITSKSASKDMSPQEQMKLLQQLKQFSPEAATALEEYFKEDDSFLNDAMDKMTKNPEEYTTQDKIDFLKDYVGLGMSLDIFDDSSFFKGGVTNAGVENILKLFEEASPEQMNELVQYLPPATLAKAIQTETSLGTETKMLERLMKAVGGIDESGKVSTDIADYKGLTQEEVDAAKKEYVKEGVSDTENVQSVLKAVEDEKISPEMAKYLLADITGGDVNEIISNFRDMSSEEQELYIKELFTSFTPATTPLVVEEVEATEEVSETDTDKEVDGAGKTGNKTSLKPADTLEEFLASVTDSQAKEWYTKMFTEMGYDYDTFWDTSNIPRDFQSVYTNPFSTGTIRKAGCGITSLSMISEWLTGEYKSPVELAGGYRGDNPASQLEKGLNASGVDWDRAFNDKMSVIDQQLAEGEPVIINVREGSIFTEGGHFMVITGKTADGKYIVNDPNIENYLKPYLADGFKNGFTAEQISQGLSHVIYFNR